MPYSAPTREVIEISLVPEQALGSPRANNPSGAITGDSSLDVSAAPLLSLTRPDVMATASSPNWSGSVNISRSFDMPTLPTFRPRTHALAFNTLTTMLDCLAVGGSTREASGRSRRTHPRCTSDDPLLRAPVVTLLPMVAGFASGTLMAENIWTLLSDVPGMQEKGLFSLGVVFFIGALIFIPRTPTCILGGLIFGLPAFPAALFGSTFGAIVGFLLSRYLFRSRFHEMAGRQPKLRLIVDAIDAEGWRLLSLLRLASPVPGTVSNYLFGLTSIKILPYTAATLLGSAPQVLAFVYLGAACRVVLDVHSVSTAKLVFTLVGCALSVVAVWIIIRRVKSSLAVKLACQAN